MVFARGMSRNASRIQRAGVSRNATQVLCQPVNSPAPPTHYPLYNSDKLSRFAPPSELNERHSTYGIRSLAEGRTLGAHFAGVIGGPP